MGTALPDNFEIAPGYRVKQWRSLSLSDADGSTADWSKALEIFTARIRTRFIEPAQLLIDAESSDGRGKHGFAVLAIDFLLIETLEGFKSGKTSHIGQSKALFKAFLTAWPAFTACLTPAMNADDLAVNVYEQGRCALHHTGSTDGMIVRRSGKMIVFHSDGRIEINRTLLHGELTKAFDGYIADLRAGPNADLRRKFKAKMNHICGL